MISEGEKSQQSFGSVAIKLMLFKHDFNGIIKDIVWLFILSKPVFNERIPVSRLFLI